MQYGQMTKTLSIKFKESRYATQRFCDVGQYIQDTQFVLYWPLILLLKFKTINFEQKFKY